MPNLSMSQGLPNPEWVICGMQMTTGVRIVASKTLTRAELEAQVQHQDIFDGPFPVASVMSSYHLILTTRMRDCVIIDGPDYPTCLKHLFEEWSPDQEVRKPITPAARAIEAAIDRRRQIGS